PAHRARDAPAGAGRGTARRLRVWPARVRRGDATGVAAGRRAAAADPRHDIRVLTRIGGISEGGGMRRLLLAALGLVAGVTVLLSLKSAPGVTRPGEQVPVEQQAAPSGAADPPPSGGTAPSPDPSSGPAPG